MTVRAVRGPVEVGAARSWTDLSTALGELADGLTGRERERVAAFRRPVDAQRFAVGRVLCRSVLAA